MNNYDTQAMSLLLDDTLEGAVYGMLNMENEDSDSIVDVYVKITYILKLHLSIKM